MKLCLPWPSLGAHAIEFALHAPSSRVSAKILAQRAIKRQFGVIFPVLGELFRVSTSFTPRRANIFALAPTQGQAGRKTSLTRRANVARLKPTTPLLTPNKGPLKPTSPLHPKNAPDKPISSPQRRCRFHSHTDTSKQRRQGLQTTGPPDRQGLAAVPVGGGGARPGDQWADDVTNVVKPERFEGPSENFCYKRRQSAPKNHYFQRKSRRIDDVCNNGSEIHTKNTSD